LWFGSYWLSSVFVTEQNDSSGLSASGSFPLPLEADALPLMVYVAMQDAVAGECWFDTELNLLLIGE
jgi:hypothetical protein